MPSMKNSLLLGIVMLAIGIAIGWIAKPVPDAGKTPVADVSPKKSTPTTTAETPPTVESPILGKRAIRPAAQAKLQSAEPTAEEMDQANEMQAKMTKNMVDRQRQRFEKQIDHLTESLSLTSDQKAKLTAWLDERLKDFGDLDLTNPASAQKMLEVSKLLSDESLQAQLAGMLTPDQQTALTDYQDREHRSKVDAIALKSLSNLQGIIQFEDGQRDKVYALLSESAEESLAAKSKAQWYDNTEPKKS
jgi:hypothetical protein